MSHAATHYTEQRVGELGSAGNWLILAGSGIFLLFSGCAGQAYPPGGERDIVPPAIIRTSPDTNAVRVSTGEITLEFSEYVDRRSVEEAIFISPTLGPLEFDWSGKEITILFKEPLKPQTTYVVSVGTDVIDLRERNRMAAGYALAFSTGDSLDRGEIEGRVVDDRPEGVMIFAYRLDQIRPDTLDPARKAPDFIMQTGAAGGFLLSHLPMDTYRLFAVRDEYRDFRYDREVDQIGMAAGDVRLNPGRLRAAGVLFQLTREDTTRPMVAGATVLTGRQIDLRFSEPLDSLFWPADPFLVTDTLSGKRIPIAASFWKRSQPPTVGLILAAPLDSPATYRVSAAGVRDRRGNGLLSTNTSVTVEGTFRPDTLPPAVTIEALRDSARGIPLDASPVVEISEPVDRDRCMRGVSLLDSLRRPVNAAWSWVSDRRLRCVPASQLKPLAWYRIAVVLDSISGTRPPRYADSVLAVRFQTIDLRATGEVGGSLVDARSAGHRYVMDAARIDQAGSEPRQTLLVGPGAFTLRQVPEGRYAFSAFEDRDSSGTYSYGQPHPYVASERFALSRDTVKVRARWGVEGVRLVFP